MIKMVEKIKDKKAKLPKSKKVVRFNIEQKIMGTDYSFYLNPSLDDDGFNYGKIRLTVDSKTTFQENSDQD